MKNKILKLFYSCVLGLRWKEKGWSYGMRSLADEFLKDYKMKLYSPREIASIQLR